MLTKEERLQIREEIATELRSVQRIDERDVGNKYPHLGLEGPNGVRKLLWEAREVVRLSDGIDFGPLRGWPGVFERKDWSQIERRASNQRAKGTRAHRRAEERLRLAATLAPDQSKERLNEAADRVALRLAMRSARG